MQQIFPPSANTLVIVGIALLCGGVVCAALAFSAFAREGENQIEFHLRLTRDGAGDLVTLLAHVCPGDDAEPVVTIGFPEDF
jgi:hypothetical protein